MNSHALSDKAKHLAKKYNVTSNLIINHYFFDSFLKRLAKSEYRNHLVLKGGYLLSIELGIMTRTTNDLDFLLQNENLSEKFILNMINDIILIDIMPCTAKKFEGQREEMTQKALAMLMLY